MAPSETVKDIQDKMIATKDSQISFYKGKYLPFQYELL